MVVEYNEGNEAELPECFLNFSSESMQLVGEDRFDIRESRRATASQ